MKMLNTSVLLRLIAALLVSGLASASVSADSQYDWSGPYAGATLSADMFRTEANDYWCWYSCDAPGDSSLGYQAGLFAGYHFPIGGNFVAGLEADLSSGLSHSEKIRGGGYGAEWSSEWNWLATVRGKAGLAVDRTLVYVTGGLAFADADYSVKELNAANPDSASYSGSVTGLALGVGVEHALSDTLRFRASYMGVHMPKKRACWKDASGECMGGPGNDDDSVHWTTTSHSIQAGMSWVF